LLRRTRIGLLLSDGGASHFDRIGTICREELGWSDARWNDERQAYATVREAHYGAPHA